MSSKAVGEIELELVPLRKDDLPFLCEVRHHRETLPYLHDQRVFSLDEVRRWYARDRPPWYVIWFRRTRVGYVRISDLDIPNLSIKVGADVHPSYRRQGIARAAYQVLLSQLKDHGWTRAWLEVLASNKPALNLYRALGFEESKELLPSGKGRQSIVMSIRIDQPKTGKNVKVVSVYLGPRRSPPRHTKDAVKLLGFLLEKEAEIDPGCQTDTLLVYNRIQGLDAAGITSDMRKGEDLLERSDGTATRRGVLRVLVRNNDGLSFGCYNHAFAEYSSDYDYWLFTEDDQIMVKDGYYSQAVEQLQANPKTGFIALVGVSRDPRYPPHAHGGVGVSRRDVLVRVRLANATHDNPKGTLPHHDASGYDQQIEKGEIRFTNSIARLGYRLENLNDRGICMSWGCGFRRTPLMTPWGNSPRSYGALGLRIISRIVLPELSEYENTNSDHPSVHITTGGAPDNLVQATYQDPNCEISSRAILLRRPGLAFFQLVGGRTIVVDRLVDSWSPLLRSQLLTDAMDLLLLQRGAHVIRGAALQREGRTTVILGESPQGRSAILRSFLQIDYQLVSDEFCLLKSSKGTDVLAQSTIPFWRLPETPAAEETHLETCTNFEPGLFPVERMILLDPKGPTTPRPLVGVEKFTALIESAYSPHLLMHTLAGQSFASDCLRIAEAVPIWTVGLPDPSSAAYLMHQIAEELAR
jgi:ribosomal protein S18 acetylase RimI-like enzyme